MVTETRISKLGRKNLTVSDLRSDPQDFESTGMMVIGHRTDPLAIHQPALPLRITAEH